jgi:riboflavin synthase
MFTGIVEEAAPVRSMELDEAGNGRLSVAPERVLEGLKLGDSIAVNGACLTVVSLDGGAFEVDLAPETLRKTNLGALRKGHVVNLERPLAVGDRLGGHIVQGHIDATGRVQSASPEAGCVVMGFRTPKRLMPYIVKKGFVAVDGISLTVVNRRASSFTVSVIPYTLEHTALKERRVGDSVNLEVDVLAKYVESLVKP